jgi:hypothetical protein
MEAIQKESLSAATDRRGEAPALRLAGADA